MAHLIDKDALVAEIERQISAIDNCPKITNTQISVLEGDKVVLTKLLSFIDTLEVKEVDLEKVFLDEYSKFSNDVDAMDYAFPIDLADYKDFAKHFFELGMCAANPLTVKDIEKIYHLVNEVSDDLGVRAMYVNIYKETLKRFKAQKGE